MKDKLKNLSRRDVMKILGLGSAATLLAACAPEKDRPPLIDPGGWEPLEGVVSLFENFTEYNSKYYGDILEKLSQEYGVPAENNIDFDINLLPNSDVGIDDAYNMGYLQIGFSDNNRAIINIGVGTFEEIVLNQLGHLPSAPEELGWISARVSHAVLEGYALIAAERGLISEWKARKKAQDYYYDIFNPKNSGQVDSSLIIVEVSLAQKQIETQQS